MNIDQILAATPEPAWVSNSVELLGEHRVPPSEFAKVLFLWLTATEWGIESYWEAYSTGLDLTIAQWVQMAQEIVHDPDRYAADEGGKEELLILGFPHNMTINSIREWMLSQ